MVHVQAFSPVDRPTMPSADFSMLFQQRLRYRSHILALMGDKHGDLPG